MVKITNSKITNVKVCFDDYGRLSAIIRFEGQASCYNDYFPMMHRVAVQELSALMNYTNSYDIMNLNGKVVRLIESGTIIHGFGHPFEDKFILRSPKKFTEITEVELKTLFDE